MKKLFLLFALLCVSGWCIGQQATIQGVVRDADSHDSIPFATVAVLNADSTVLTGTVTDETGRFSLPLTNSGTYVVSVSFIGYQTTYQTITANNGDNEMPTVFLVPDATMLQSVQVVAKAPLVEQQIDKLVMNVAQSAFAQGNTALDLLRKAPGVSVDKDGNVLLNGQSVAVWIDGRPSQLDGKSLEMLLRGTDGSSIDKIEIMANPSAKYDAEGQGGIINIKTKRHFAQGFNGSLSADLGGMTFRRQHASGEMFRQFMPAQGLNLNLGYRTEKTNTFVQLSEQTERMGVDYSNSLDGQVSGQQFHQESLSPFDVRTAGYTLKVGNDWFVDSKNTIGVIFTMPFSTMNQLTDSNGCYSFQQLGDAVMQQSVNQTLTDYAMRQYMGNINYTHVFNEAKASELTANLDYFHNATISENQQDNYYLPLLTPLVWNTALFDSNKVLNLNSQNLIDIYSAKVDYQRVVLGAFLMEAGAKWALSQTDNELTQFTSTLLRGDESPATNSISNSFDYTEHIGALYATLAGQFSPRWSAKVGLRGEYTYAYNSVGTVNQNYFDLFPTVFVGYNTPDYMKRLNLSYTRRIQRPSYMMLNPFRNYVDAHTCNVGNPDLKPAYSDNVQLIASLGRYVSLNVSYIHQKDVLTSISTIDPETGDQLVRNENFGRQDLLGGGLTLAELPLGKQFSLLVNAQAFDFHSQDARGSLVQGMEDIPMSVDKHSFFGSLYACLTWNLPKSWKVQLDGWFSSPISTGYLSVDGNKAVNFGVKKSTADSRLTFSLNVNDLFRTMNTSMVMHYGADFESHITQCYLMQKVKVGLQWNFGTSQKPLKRRKVGDLDELGRTGSNTGLSLGNEK